MVRKSPRSTGPQPQNLWDALALDDPFTPVSANEPHPLPEPSTGTNPDGQVADVDVDDLPVGALQHTAPSLAPLPDGTLVALDNDPQLTHVITGQDASGIHLAPARTSSGTPQTVTRDRITTTLTPHEHSLLTTDQQASVAYTGIAEIAPEPDDVDRWTRAVTELSVIAPQTITIGHSLSHGLYLQAPRGPNSPSARAILHAIYRSGLPLTWDAARHLHRIGDIPVGTPVNNVQVGARITRLSEMLTAAGHLVHDTTGLAGGVHSPNTVAVGALVADLGDDATRPLVVAAVTEGAAWVRPEDGTDEPTPVPWQRVALLSAAPSTPDDQTVADGNASPAPEVMDAPTAAAPSGDAAPVLRVGDRVLHNSGDTVVWDGLPEGAFETWTIPTLAGPMATPHMRTRPTAVAPTTAAPVDLTDPRISARKVTSLEAANAGHMRGAGWIATYTTSSGARTRWGKTKTSATTKAAAALRVADWHHSTGWATEGDALPAVDTAAIRPGDQVTLLDRDGTHHDDEPFVVVDVDEHGVSLAPPTDAATAVRATVFARIATHTPATTADVEQGTDDAIDAEPPASTDTVETADEPTPLDPRVAAALAEQARRSADLAGTPFRPDGFTRSPLVGDVVVHRPTASTTLHRLTAFNADTATLTSIDPAAVVITVPWSQVSEIPRHRLSSTDTVTDRVDATQAVLVVRALNQTRSEVNYKHQTVDVDQINPGDLVRDSRWLSVVRVNAQTITCHLLNTDGNPVRDRDRRPVTRRVDRSSIAAHLTLDGAAAVVNDRRAALAAQRAAIRNTLGFDDDDVRALTLDLADHVLPAFHDPISSRVLVIDNADHGPAFNAGTAVRTAAAIANAGIVPERVVIASAALHKTAHAVMAATYGPHAVAAFKIGGLDSPSFDLTPARYSLTRLPDVAPDLLAAVAGDLVTTSGLPVHPDVSAGEPAVVDDVAPATTPAADVAVARMPVADLQVGDLILWPARPWPAQVQGITPVPGGHWATITYRTAAGGALLGTSADFNTTATVTVARGQAAYPWPGTPDGEALAARMHAAQGTTQPIGPITAIEPPAPHTGTGTPSPNQGATTAGTGSDSDAADAAWAQFTAEALDPADPWIAPPVDVDHDVDMVESLDLEKTEHATALDTAPEEPVNDRSGLASRPSTSTPALTTAQPSTADGQRLAGTPVRWSVTGTTLLAPTGKRSRVSANLDALAVLRTLDAEHRYATAAEQEVLARWSAWGAVPEVFEAASRAEWGGDAAKVEQALDAVELARASATTRNAHYTDPRVAAAMWSAMRAYGITAGTVLEPGAGAGIFEGLAPDGVQMVGVELDPVTARINAALNPHAHVINAGMETLRLGGRTPVFEGAIGNVPFDDVRLHDPIDNPHRLSLHNHFIAKSLAHTRPGGLVMLLTSSWTMDAKTSTARAHLASMGHLLGAVRLPSGAMRDAAGTQVVMDLLVLRKYAETDTPDLAPDWLNLTPADNDGNTINAYFAQHPEKVLGQVSFVNGQYAQVINVTGPTGEPMAAALSEQLSQIIDDARTAGRTPPAPNPAPAWATPGLHVPPATGALRHGHTRVQGARFETWDADSQTWTSKTVKAAAALEVRDLLSVRDAALNVLTVQSTPSTSDAERDQARTALGGVYDAYRAKWGPVSRFVLKAHKPTARERAERVKELEADWRARELPAELTPAERSAAAVPDEIRERWVAQAAEPEMLPDNPHLAPLATDPGMALLLALENYDETTGAFTRSAIFTRDLIAAHTPATHADTPDEALAIALDENVTVDLARVAALLDLPSEDDAFTALGDLVYRDPDTAEVIPAHLYLSGDVRAKLDSAQAAASEEFTRNVTALQAVVPEPVALEDIAIRPGARWLGTDLHVAFIEDVLGVHAQVTVSEINDRWEVTGPAGAAIPAHVRLTYGTGERSPITLLEAAMNNTPVTVWETDPVTKSRYVNRVATTAARGKQTDLETAFTAWLAADPDRAERVATEYNRIFNSYVSPDYTHAGQRLSLPGLSAAMTPHPHQRAAVARVLTSPATLLDHVVGAGKTGVMIMSAMELRRLGIASHPWVVVPNHLVAQVAKEWKQWYPTANVLPVPTGAPKAVREEYIARAAVGDFDAVIVGRSTFKQMPLSSTRTATWLQSEIDDLRALHEAASSEDRSYIKRIERSIKQVEAKYARMTDPTNRTLVAFEQSGADFLFVDEAHGYKNLARESAASDLSHGGSDIARDLDYKLRALREARAEQGHPGAPVACFATGTPVANALAEAWVMQHYLRPDLLAAAGMESIDAWARQFATVRSKLELGPDGSTWRVKDRVSQFVNLPELVALNEVFTDTVTKDVLAGALPTMAEGARQMVSREASAAVVAYVRDLAARANSLPSDPAEDNLLKISNDGRLVALDPRLRGLPADDDGGRVGQVAEKVMAIAAATSDNIYRLPDGAESPTRGALQLVFCDRSTPTRDGSWNFYDALAEDLVARGMPRDQIAFIHDADSDAARAALYDRANSGRLRVLIGSTEKMGTGTNVQTRLTAIHHADCPWRPADLEQREGRGFRQGNQNEQVAVYTYLTAGTYDAVTWQIITRKAEFIAQLRTTTTRTIEDSGTDLVVSAALAQAIATGDERVMRRAELSETVSRLEALEAGWRTGRNQARYEARSYTERAAMARTRIERIQAALPLVRPTSGENFSYTRPDGLVLTDRGAARDHLAAITTKVMTGKITTPTAAGTFAGLPITATYVGGVRFDVADTGVAVTLIRDEAMAPHRVDVPTRLENAISHLQEHLDRDLRDAPLFEARAADAIVALAADETFPQAAALEAARGELAEIDEALAMTGDERPSTPDGPVMVTGEQLAATRATSGEVTCNVGDLRNGDIVQVSGKERVPAGMYTISVDASRPGARTLTGVDDPNVTGSLPAYTTVVLVARELDKLADVEKAALAAGDTDRVIGSAQAATCKVGDRVTALLLPATATVVHPESNAPAWKKAFTAYEPVPNAAPVTMTGVLVKTGFADYAPTYVQRGWVLRTDDGTEHAVRPVPDASIPIVRHDVVQPAPDGVDGLSLAELLPGDKAHGVTRPDGNPDVVIPDTVTRVAGSTSYTRSLDFLADDDGRTLHVPADTPLLAARVTVGRDLTPQEAQTVFGPGWTNQTASKLRPGDRSTVKALDPKAKATTAATITAVRYDGGRTVLTYTPDGSTMSAAVGRKNDTIVPITSRRAGALTQVEARLLTPGTRQITTPEHAETRAPVWVAACSYPRREARTGSVVGAAGQALDVRWDDGQVETLKINTHNADTVIAYPTGTTIPDWIDPTTLTGLTPGTAKDLDPGSGVQGAGSSPGMIGAGAPPTAGPSTAGPTL